ncbi:hypothetical protein [Sphingomonas endolithica]|uniref:hypothetical protein n=1 Tax=Sphingomonas endolithica TaxID=2972485 RepID=UPI0021B05A84|nr:hypothetical protein [Sphingomonas sp. ZFBP2030]
MSDDKKKRALILSTFTDAGTLERFTEGDTPLLDAGVFANYEAAGLVGAPTPTPAAKPRRAAPKNTKRPTPKTPAAPAPAVDPAPEVPTA